MSSGLAIRIVMLTKSKLDLTTRADGLRITATDIVKAGHCIRGGAMPWFRRHGLDFRKFMKEGIDAVEFIERGDAYAERVVILTLERREKAKHG